MRIIIRLELRIVVMALVEVLVVEWQVHSIAANFTRTLMALIFVHLALLSNGDYYNIYERSAHVDLGSSIAAEDDWYVRLPSYILKWIIKILSFNSLER